jgi:DNA adenine methylase
MWWRGWIKKESKNPLDGLGRGVQRTCFGGKVAGQTYGARMSGKPGLNLLTLQTTLENTWQLLAHVQIECMDFRTLLPRYDRPHSFLFLDPPYWQIPGYKYDFTEQDFYDLREILEGVEGNFLMTINDTSDIRDIFSCFSIEEVNLRYSCCSSAKGRAKLRTELLVSN